MALHAASDAAVQVYAKALGMPFAVVRAWANCEEQDDSNYSPNNILNIEYGNTPGQWGKSPNGVTATYPTLALGASWTAWLIANGPYEGIRSAVKLGTAFGIARAIENSPWAASHYGSTSTTSGCISRQIKATPPAISDPLRWSLNVTNAQVTVKEGSVLYYLDGRTRYSVTNHDVLTVFSAPLISHDAGGWTAIKDGLYLAAVPNNDLASTS